MALSWQQAGWVAVILAACFVALRLLPWRWSRAAAPFARESCLIAGLYTLWQWVAALSVTGTSGAQQRARWIERVEHDAHLPSEASVQRLILGHRLVVETANLYYDTMHFSMLFVFLVWLFVRHRDHYARVRTTLVLTTFACLAVQLMPVAPPRLMPGFVDTAQLYGQSVYALGFGADQLSAMPSVHVAWAVLVGWYAVRIGRSRWRWLGPAHAAITVFVVVATGNHWWSDGIVAVSVLACCAWLTAGGAAALDRIRRRCRRSSETPEDVRTDRDGALALPNRHPHRICS